MAQARGATVGSCPGQISRSYVSMRPSAGRGEGGEVGGAAAEAASSSSPVRAKRRSPVAPNRPPLFSPPAHTRARLPGAPQPTTPHPSASRCLLFTYAPRAGGGASRPSFPESDDVGRAWSGAQISRTAGAVGTPDIFAFAVCNWVWQPGLEARYAPKPARGPGGAAPHWIERERDKWRAPGVRGARTQAWACVCRNVM